ncbi:hypothetical protein RKD42_001539 [Streptomyces ambofaciens]
MAAQPGDGCDDPRPMHSHWCGICGAQRLFSSEECKLLMVTPPCPRCYGADWRSEVDALTSPDRREQ